MTGLPDSPIPAPEFFEELIPALFARVVVPAEEAQRTLTIAVVLTGEGGGEWSLAFAEGQLEVSAVRAAEAELTLIQDVTHWRSALWEGHPRLVADVVDRVRDGNLDEIAPPGSDGERVDPLRGISDLRGRVEIVIAGADAGAEGDWKLGVMLGAGPIPEEPNATIHLGSVEAEEIRQGNLHPLEALITGRLQLDGDLGLILQLQAVAMTLSSGG